MKVLREFVPTRKFLKLAEETKDLVDGWNITDSAAGRPAPSGTAVGRVLKTRECSGRYIVYRPFWLP